MGDLKSLIQLRLDNNRLENIPETISNLSSLQWLDISRCNLEQIPLSG